MNHRAIIVDNSEQRTIDLGDALVARGKVLGRHWEYEPVGLEHPAQALQAIFKKIKEWDGAVTVLCLDVRYSGTGHRYAGIDVIYEGLRREYGEKERRKLFFCSILKDYKDVKVEPHATDYKDFQTRLKKHVPEPYELIGPALDEINIEAFAERANEVARKWEEELDAF